MRSGLHLSCFIAVSVLLSGCDRGRSEQPADDLPPPAREVEPVPEVPANPIVSVPRPDISAPAPTVSSAPSRSPEPASQPREPDSERDTLTRPAPPLDTRPSIPRDSIVLRPDSVR